MKSKRLMNTLIKNESGVTLVELLASIAILSIVVTAFLAFFIQAANTNQQTNEVNEATFLAQEELELVTSYSLEELTGEEVINKYFDGDLNRTTFKDSYTIETTLTEPTEDSALYKVNVTVEGGRKLAEMETRLPFEKNVE